MSWQLVRRVRRVCSCASVRLVSSLIVPFAVLPHSTVRLREFSIDYIDNEIHWHTFAGGRINSTLRYALGSIGGDWKILPDNFRIRVTADNLAPAEFNLALEQIRQPDFWENDDLWQQIADGLPNYRLSKFQPLMPDWVQREMVGDFLLEVPGSG